MPKYMITHTRYYEAEIEASTKPAARAFAEEMIRRHEIVEVDDRIDVEIIE